MSCCRTGAECRTICKIVAVALVGSMSMVMLAMSLVVSIAAWRAETEAPMPTRAKVPLFEAGTPGTGQSSTATG